MIRTALEFIKKELDAYMVERENDVANYCIAAHDILGRFYGFAASLGTKRDSGYRPS